MKIQEILQKIIGLDPSKDYDITLDEIKGKENTTPPENNDDDKPGVDNNSTAELEILRKQIAELNSENSTLKELNKQLVLNTPAEPEKTVEQRIMELCYPELLFSKGEEAV